MTSPLAFSLFNLAIITLSFLPLILCPVSCLHHLQPLNYPRSLLFEEKTRLGSTPPSCHSKCNGCHPCEAVQVPSVPSGGRVGPSHQRVRESGRIFDPLSGGYSNYKPLGWKCKCRGHFYNP